MNQNDYNNIIININKLIGKTIRISLNYSGSDKEFCIGVLKKIYYGTNTDISFILYPKLVKDVSVDLLEDNNTLSYLEDSEEYSDDYIDALQGSVFYSNQDLIFENFYWSIKYSHTITSNLIQKIDIVETFEEELKNWKEVGPKIINKFIKIELPLLDMIESYFLGYNYKPVANIDKLFNKN